MRLPIKRPKSASTLSLPDLAGGLNLRDGVNEISDNQLTACKNMWWHEGALKTRLGLNENEKFTIVGSAGIGAKAPIKAHNCYKDFGGKKVRLYSVDTFVHREYDDDYKAAYIHFFWMRGGSVEQFATITFENTLSVPQSYFVAMNGTKVYCYTSDCEIYVSKEIEEENEKKIIFEKVTEEQLYVPLVLTACRSIGKKSVTKEQVMSSGTMIEGFNILSDYYEMRFSSFNSDLVTVENPEHEMRYHLPESVAKAKYEGKTVTAVYKKDGQEHTHTIVLDERHQSRESNNMWQEDGPHPGDHMIMKVWKNNVTFWYDSDTIATVSEGDEEDLIITAPYVSSDDEKKKAFKMTRAEWFGGGSAGIAGGTRLFLCGNEDYPNLCAWSGLNNPLYFPEHAFFNVGESSSKVMGFGKQSDKLIIFKENETWFTEYAQNNNIDAESLMSGSVVDYASSSVYFPLVQINNNIGCGYPDTVQLCRNRLVWLGSDGKFYTLVSESPYTERSIYCVSEMVDEITQEITALYALPNVTACDWNGYYCILLNDTLLLMDYNCYGYTHIASYSKTEDANKNIPWFVWELPKCDIVYTVGNTLCVAEFEYYSNLFCNIRSFVFGNYSIDTYFDDKGETSENPIESSFATKVFDFGVPHIRKNVEQINIQFTDGAGETVTVTAMSDSGITDEAICLLNEKDYSNAAGFVESRAVFPCIKQIIRFGLKMECSGPFAVDSIVLKFRTLGGAR